VDAKFFITGDTPVLLSHKTASFQHVQVLKFNWLHVLFLTEPLH